MSKPVVQFPPKGATLQELAQEVNALRRDDVDWRAGRAFCLVYHPGEDRDRKIKAVYDMYHGDNALNPTATPSLTRLEAEVVSMTADLLGGNSNIRGNVTTGGTESILMAVKTAREWAVKNKPHIKKPHVVVPSSVHPAFMKAFHYFGLSFTAVPTGADFRANPEAMNAAITKDTVLIVASAPSYPYGVMDPVENIAAMASKAGILCHVDACVGGYMLPFVKAMGLSVPPFDFSVPGVTSISADVHKYGYAPKGASVILYKTAALRKFQFSWYTGWNGGIYGSPTMTGTRSGSCIAGAWAALKGIGYDGYLEMAKATMDVTNKIRAFIEQNPHLILMGHPEMSILAFRSDSIDVFRLADELNKRGWHFERQHLPPSLHFTINYIHRNSVDQFLADLETAVEAASQKNWKDLANVAQNTAVKVLSKVLPGGTIAGLQKKFGGNTVSKGDSAAMYGMMGALNGSEDLEELVVDFLDKINSLPETESQ